MAAIRGRAGRRVTLDPSSLAVSLGRPHGPGAPVNPPIGLSSTYRLGGDTIYGRDDSPTWSAFEEVLEGSRAAGPSPSPRAWPPSPPSSAPSRSAASSSPPAAP